MSANKNSFITKPIILFLITILIASVIGFVAHLLSQNWIPATALAYAIFNHIFSGLKTKRLKSEFNVEKINILKRVCTDKISLARNLSKSYNHRSLVYCLIELEFLVTEIANCCDNTDDRINFRTVKGLLGSTKTTFDKSTFDKSIPRPYSDVVKCIGGLESYLNDI